MKFKTNQLKQDYNNLVTKYAYRYDVSFDYAKQIVGKYCYKDNTGTVYHIDRLCLGL